MNVLVTGGAGYIGSHTVLSLLEIGHTPIILDDFSGGATSSTPLWLERVYVSDFAQKDVLNQIHDNHKIDGVIHFAGKIQVGESMKNPDLYYHHNVAKTMVLLDWMVERNIRRFVFSSSAAVYGDYGATPIPETAPMCPTSPYGRSKAAVEILASKSRSIEPVFLRYFNASGADPALRTGERHSPETHLIPLAIQAAINDSVFNVFGHDLKSTPDGSCVRDFVHVSDLADAHVKALEMPFYGRPKSFNLGSGTGYSVFQILDQIEKEHGSGPRISLKPSRPGDPPFLVADPSRARVELGWEPKFSDLETIIKTAYSWEQKNIRDRSI